MSDLGFRAFGVWSLGFRVWGLGLRAWPTYKEAFIIRRLASASEAERQATANEDYLGYFTLELRRWCLGLMGRPRSHNQNSYHL